jgi:hypothetical protein
VPPLLDPIPFAPWQPNTYYCCLLTDLQKARKEYREIVAEGIPHNEYLLPHQAKIQLKHRVFEVRAYVSRQRNICRQVGSTRVYYMIGAIRGRRDTER